MNNKIIRKKLLLRRITTIFLFFILFVLWTYYYFMQSDFFELREVLVSGNSIIEENVVVKLSELEFGRNILKYNLTNIENSISTHPYVKNVNVRRKLFNTIIIDITERLEYAIIIYMGSNIYIDKDAKILKADDSYFKQNLPLITSVELLDFSVGEYLVLSNENKLERALQIIQAAKATEIINLISEISLREENIRIITVDGIEVIVSETECPVYMMLALEEILSELESINRKNVIVDMRNDGVVTVRERDVQEED
ncbi:MAG: peptidase S33 [Alkaliphilus sp.]|nr:FtsQ-type POTRA domain-containing protein [bacterium AH-315-E09]PHS36466.1 MAG: peptidase S33 [Alkaliphilus sp.]